MRPIYFVLVSLIALNSGCHKQNVGPTTGEDQEISRVVSLAFTDRNGQNLIGVGRKYPKHLVKSSAPNNPHVFYTEGWTEDSSGAYVSYPYFTSLAHPGARFSSFRFETYHYYQFPGNDIDTLLYQKLTDNETKFFYNGRLVGTHPAEDTSTFRLAVVKE